MGRTSLEDIPTTGGIDRDFAAIKAEYEAKKAEAAKKWKFQNR